LIDAIRWNRWPRLTGMLTKGIKREMWSLQWNIAANPDKALRLIVRKAVLEAGC
jgi:hypothetical protein